MECVAGATSVQSMQVHQSQMDFAVHVQDHILDRTQRPDEWPKSDHTVYRTYPNPSTYYCMYRVSLPDLPELWSLSVCRKTVQATALKSTSESWQLARTEFSYLCIIFYDLKKLKVKLSKLLKIT
jgi:hypothetical protein